MQTGVGQKKEADASWQACAGARRREGRARAARAGAHGVAARPSARPGPTTWPGWLSHWCGHGELGDPEQGGREGLGGRGHGTGGGSGRERRPGSRGLLSWKRMARHMPTASAAPALALGAGATAAGRGAWGAGAAGVAARVPSSEAAWVLAPAPGRAGKGHRPHHGKQWTFCGGGWLGLPHPEGCRLGPSAGPAGPPVLDVAVDLVDLVQGREPLNEQLHRHRAHASSSWRSGRGGGRGTSSTSSCR
jgi:hypothetical protein